jgi:arabinose-5-phosphate isomerase
MTPMAASPLPADAPLSRFDQLRLAREVIRSEAQTLLGVADRLGDEFCRAVEILCAVRGSVLVSGMGKAGLVGQKIAATLASTGTRSHFLHPGEAIHGDLGRVHAEDALLVLSFSGQTEEIVRLLPSLVQLGTPLVAITGQPESPLGRHAAVVLDLGPVREACPLGLAPTASTTAMLALGDALALVLSRLRHFTPEDFARFHPGGSIGRRLTRVEEVMRPLAECRVAQAGQSLRQTLVATSRPGRRTGAIMITDDEGRLAGIFTDSDLARLLEARHDGAIDGPLSAVMTRHPATIAAGSPLPEACGILSGRKISELPVVDEHGSPIGLIDITDVVAEVQSPKSKVPNQQRRTAPHVKLHKPA